MHWIDGDEYGTPDKCVATADMQVKEHGSYRARDRRETHCRRFRMLETLFAVVGNGTYS